MQGNQIPEEVSLAKEVLKELEEMEQENRNTQHVKIIKSFGEYFKNNGSSLMYYHDIIYDEVRQKLETEGFSVKTVTYDKYGRTAYLITKKEDSHILDSELGSSIV